MTELQTTYAVFQDGKQISKEHSTKEACAVEAFELGCVVSGTWDFNPKEDFGKALAFGCEIKEISK